MGRDYSLVGKDAALAAERGLASAQWQAAVIARKDLKELMRRSDGPAIRDTLIWALALAVTGGMAAWCWGTFWAVPWFLLYGPLYGSASDSRWHECGHGTAFKTRWMNDVVYHVACFMILREPTVWRWSHTRHHTDTIIVGRDPEVAVPRPPNIPVLLLNFFAIPNTITALRKLVLHAAGRLTAEEQTFIPAMEQGKVFGIARLYLAIFAAVALACIASASLLPAMLIGLPTLYGAWLAQFFGLTQHSGLAEDVLDHRLNTRTVRMNPLELPSRAPHVSEGAVPRLAKAASGDQGPVPAGLSRLHRSLPRNHSRPLAPAP